MTTTKTSKKRVTPDNGPVILKLAERRVRVERPPIFRGMFSGPRTPHQLPYGGVVR